MTIETLSRELAILKIKRSMGHNIDINRLRTIEKEIMQLRRQDEK